MSKKGSSEWLDRNGWRVLLLIVIFLVLIFLGKCAKAVRAEGPVLPTPMVFDPPEAPTPRVVLPPMKPTRSWQVMSEAEQTPTLCLSYDEDVIDAWWEDWPEEAGQPPRLAMFDLRFWEWPREMPLAIAQFSQDGDGVWRLDPDPGQVFDPCHHRIANLRLLFEGFDGEGRNLYLSPEELNIGVRDATRSISRGLEHQLQGSFTVHGGPCHEPLEVWMVYCPLVDVNPLDQ